VAAHFIEQLDSRHLVVAPDKHFAGTTSPIPDKLKLVEHIRSQASFAG
jgi:hypothetical protein